MKKLFDKLFMDLEKVATPTAREIFLAEKPNPKKLKQDEFSFFSSLKLTSGVTKTTNRDRMRDVDAWFVEFLPKERDYKILDVGISSGITTVELSEALDARKLKYQITAMDSDITAYLLDFSDGKSVLVDRQGNPLHFEIDGKGIGYVHGTNPKHRLTLRFLKNRGKSFAASALKNGIDKTKKMSEKDGVKIYPVDLVCREIRENPAINLLEESIFADHLPGNFDVVRAANILNKSYFTDEQLSAAARNIRKSLKTGGFFLVCRTNFEGQNNATLFELSAENKFQRRGSFGDGSEIEDLILSID